VLEPTAHQLTVSIAAAAARRGPQRRRRRRPTDRARPAVLRSTYIPPPSISAASAAYVAALSAALSPKIRVFFSFELHLGEKAVTSPAVVEKLPKLHNVVRRTPSCFNSLLLKEMGCGAHATPCTRHARTGAPGVRRAHAANMPSHTPCANAARMPCAHQVHRSRTRGRSWGRPRASRSTSRYL